MSHLPTDQLDFTFSPEKAAEYERLKAENAQLREDLRDTVRERDLLKGAASCRAERVNRRAHNAERWRFGARMARRGT